MADLNGNSFEIGRMLGNLEAHMEHQARTQDYHTEILLELPVKIAMAISSHPTSVKAPVSSIGTVAKIMMAAKEVMPPLKEIVWALIIMAGALGLIAPPVKDLGSTPATQSAE